MRIYLKMRLVILCCISLSLFCGDSNSQISKWERQYYDPGSWKLNINDLIETSDGGILLTGENYDSFWETTLLVCKLNEDGDTLWQWNVASDPYQDNRMGGYAVAEACDGYLVAGYHYHERPSNNPPWTWLVYLIKFNTVGDVLWEKSYDFSTIVTWNIAYSIAIDQNENIYLAGEGRIDGNNENAIILKTDKDGNHLWTKVYEDNMGWYLQINEFKITSDNNLIAVGYDGQIRNMAFAIKLDLDGNPLWSKKYGGANRFEDIYGERGYSVEETPDGGFIFCGSASRTELVIPGSTTNNTMLVKIDTDGNPIWSTTFDFGSFPIHVGEEHAQSIKAKGNGNFVFCTNPYMPNGGQRYDFAIVEVDGLGNMQWIKNYENSGIGNTQDVAQVIEVTSDGGMIVAGSANQTQNGAQLRGGYVVKTDSLGNSCNDIVNSLKASRTTVIPDYALNLIVTTPAVTTTNDAAALFSKTNLNIFTYCVADTSAGPVTELSACTESTDALCYGDSTGEAVITGVNGSPPFTYSWSPIGGTDSLATGLPPGVYTCTIYDINGDSSVQTITVNSPSQLSAVFTDTTAAFCGSDSSGSAIVTAGGGTAPYTYLWAPYGGTDTMAINLTPDLYSVTVTDTFGCDTTLSIPITTSTVILAAFSDTSHAFCIGDSSGYATVTPSSGTAPFTYSWSTGSTDSTAVDLPAGNYSVTITDSAGCDTSLNIAIVNTTIINAAITDTTNAFCDGDSSGIAIVTPSGGNAPYAYNWSNGDVDSTAINLAIGTYTVVVTDANGCDTVSSVNIVGTTIIDATLSETSPIGCLGDSNGIATVIPSGGNSPYAFNWTSTGDTNASASGLWAGMHQVIVTDVNACDSIFDIILTEPSQLQGSVAGTTDPTCFGFADGTASVSAAGGSNPYNYTWSSGGNTATENGLGAGAYTVTITDDHGCDTTLSVTISEPPAETMSLNGDTVICAGATASLTASGGGTYLWNTGEITPTIIVNPPAYTCYTANVTTTCGTMTDTICVVVNQPAAFNLGADTTISAYSSIILNGPGGYAYLWTPSDGLSCTNCQNPIATPGATTTYILYITDVDGCAISDSIAISLDTATAVFIPNIFSPNGDITNDAFRIYGIGIEGVEVEIYNRWGETVYKSTDVTGSWDGKLNGEPLDPATFVYNINIQFYTGREENYWGNITLVK